MPEKSRGQGGKGVKGGSFLTFEVLEAVRDQKHHISTHTLAL